jgi:hypothetical protein
MAEKTKIKRYKKTDSQSRYEKEMILKPLRKMVKDFSGKNRPIVLPKYISFRIQENSKKLFLNIEEQEGIRGTKKVIENATCKNMQTDNAAFEGWAICLKAWLPNIIETVELKWDVPHNIEKNDNKWCHYRRFLYRVLRFSEQYPWFSISNSNINEVENFKRELHSLQNNNFSKIPDPKGDFDKLSETSVEFLLSSDLSGNMIKEYDLDFIDRQFPVGIKRNKEKFFTSGLSAIDLWGAKNETLTIIELKYIPEGPKSKNIKVGIISELFMYSCIMRDIITGFIIRPDYTPNKNEDRFYDNIKNYSQIRANMLANEYHPLIENKEVIHIFNDYPKDNYLVGVEFKKAKYKLESSKKIQFYED